MEIVKGGKEVLEEKSTVYDPSKMYTWTPEVKFNMNGEQFGVILNAFRAVLSTPEANAIFQVSRANQFIDRILADAVERGEVTEVLAKGSLEVLKED